MNALTTRLLGVCTAVFFLCSASLSAQRERVAKWVANEKWNMGTIYMTHVLPLPDQNLILGSGLDLHVEVDSGIVLLLARDANTNSGSVGKDIARCYVLGAGYGLRSSLHTYYDTTLRIVR